MDTSGKRVLYQRHLKRPLFQEDDELLSDFEEEPDEQQDELGSRGTTKRAATAIQESPEHEMIFELQQVDAVEDKAVATAVAQQASIVAASMDSGENPVNLCQAESRQPLPLYNDASLYTVNKQSWFANNNYNMLHRNPPKVSLLNCY